MFFLLPAINVIITEKNSSFLQNFQKSSFSVLSVYMYLYDPFKATLIPHVFQCLFIPFHFSYASFCFFLFHSILPKVIKVYSRQTLSTFDIHHNFQTSYAILSLLTQYIWYFFLPLMTCSVLHGDLWELEFSKVICIDIGKILWNTLILWPDWDSVGRGFYPA